MTTANNRNLSLDVLRILACLAVIMIHTAGSPICHGWKGVESGTLWYDGCLVMDALCRWSVPVFAMLTGFFMLDPNKELPIGKLFGKYISRIFIALVVWSAFYAFTLHKPLYPLGSQEGHFWYLGMCIGLYLAMPVMREIVKNEKLLSYFCWTWLAMKVYRFAGVFVTLPVDFCDVLFVDYVGYCLFAYYLKVRKISHRKALLIYFMGGAGVVSTVAIGLISQNADTPFYGYTSPNVIAFSLALFLYFMRHPLRLEKTWSQWVQKCSECTFGIYLVHVWILIQTLSRMRRFIPNPIIVCPLCVFSTFFIGFGLCLIIKKIPFVNKYIV